MDLRAQSAYFYAFAAKFLEWTDREDLLQVIIDTFRSRIARLSDHAHNPHAALNEGLEFLRGLDETERACQSHALAILQTLTWQYLRLDMIALHKLSNGLCDRRTTKCCHVLRANIHDVVWQCLNRDFL